MNHLYELTGLGIVIFWLISWLLSIVFTKKLSLLGAFLISILYLYLFMDSKLVELPIAMFAPFGTVFPALIIQNVLRQTGMHIVKFSTVEISVSLILYTLFILASIGVFEFDPYRLGYNPIFGGIVAVMLIVYLYLRNYWILLCAVLIGQLAWTLDIGSSNFFDHICHTLMIPVMLVMLLSRASSKMIKKTGF